MVEGREGSVLSARQSATCHYWLFYKLLFMLCDVCLNMKLPTRTCLLQKNTELADCCLKPVLYSIKEENILQTNFQKVESGFCETPYNTKLVTQRNPATHTLLLCAVRNMNLWPNKWSTINKCILILHPVNHQKVETGSGRLFISTKYGLGFFCCCCIF